MILNISQRSKAIKWLTSELLKVNYETATV